MPANKYHSSKFHRRISISPQQNYIQQSKYGIFNSPSNGPYHNQINPIAQEMDPTYLHQSNNLRLSVKKQNKTKQKTAALKKKKKKGNKGSKAYSISFQHQCRFPLFGFRRGCHPIILLCRFTLVDLRFGSFCSDFSWYRKRRRKRLKSL